MVKGGAEGWLLVGLIRKRSNPSWLVSFCGQEEAAFIAPHAHRLPGAGLRPLAGHARAETARHGGDAGAVARHVAGAGKALRTVEPTKSTSRGQTVETRALRSEARAT